MPAKIIAAKSAEIPVRKQIFQASCSIALEKERFARDRVEVAQALSPVLSQREGTEDRYRSPNSSQDCERLLRFIALGAEIISQIELQGGFLNFVANVFHAGLHGSTAGLD